MPRLHIYWTIWSTVTILSNELTSGFVPHAVPSKHTFRDTHADTSTTTTLHGWFGKTEETDAPSDDEGQPVRFIPVEEPSTSSATSPTDVYASPMTADEIPSTDDVLDVRSTPTKPEFEEETDLDVLIVGAGCSGVGEALMLTRTFGLDPSRVLCVERGKAVGESFRRWPEEMRFISPSFNQQGWTRSFDLNAIHYDTSPAFLLRSEHPSGEDYANYLESIAEQAELKTRFDTEVTAIRDMGKGDGEGKDRPYPGPFHVDVREWKVDSGLPAVTETLSTRYVVWAAGEFQYPLVNKPKKSGSSSSPDPSDRLFPGANLCIHNSNVRSWSTLPGDEFLIIGGYESGIDAAVNLSRAGKQCGVIASTPCWNLRTGDPSSELAPYTSDRLRAVLSDTSGNPKPQLFAPLRVVNVEEAEGGGYDVSARWKAEEAPPTYRAGIRSTGEAGVEGEVVVLHTPHPPVLCTGFRGSVAARASHLFDFPKGEERKGCVGDGPLLTREDESTKVPGVYLVGPSVAHGPLSFCFVYKFRQRFAVVADAICRGLGMDTAEAVAFCRSTDMFMDDFATCEDTCGDDC